MMIPSKEQIEAASHKIEHSMNVCGIDGITIKRGSETLGTIRFALRALRLLVDMPTEDMTEAGMEIQKIAYAWFDESADDTFKAMRDKLLEKAGA